MFKASTDLTQFPGSFGHKLFDRSMKPDVLFITTKRQKVINVLQVIPIGYTQLPVVPDRSYDTLAVSPSRAVELCDSSSTQQQFV
jgi:hypothetical protein